MVAPLSDALAAASLRLAFTECVAICPLSVYISSGIRRNVQEAVALVVAFLVKVADFLTDSDTNSV